MLFSERTYMLRHFRLTLDCGAVSCLLLALAYWWQPNIVHEVLGAVLFALLCAHVFWNRRWFQALPKGRYDLRRSFTAFIHIGLLAGMLVLLITGLTISQTLFRFLDFSDAMILREAHWFSAYWVMVLVGLHLGLNIKRVVTWLRLAPQVAGCRRILLRSSAVLIAAGGIQSSYAMELGTKLSFGYSVNFWDFDNDPMLFFVHWSAIIGFYALVAAMILKLLTVRTKA